MLASLEDALPLVQGEDPQSQLLKRDVQDGICSALRYGPIPAPEGIARIEEMTPVGATGAAARWLSTPPLLAMQGDIQEARARVAAGIAYVEERGLHNLRGSLSLASAPVEVLAGDLEAAQREYADGIAVLKSTGTTGVLSTLAAERAIVLYRLGRIEEMDEAIRLARATGSPTDIATQAAWRVAASQRAADEGHQDDARGLIQEALALIEPTDFLELRGGVFEALGHVEARAGQPKGWRTALNRALAEHQRKGNLIDAKRIQDLINHGPPAALA
jgi:tetratricopeptide (TPR) repeat protein